MESRKSMKSAALVMLVNSSFSWKDRFTPDLLKLTPMA